MTKAPLPLSPSAAEYENALQTVPKDMPFAAAMTSTHQPLVVSDVTLPDLPIVFANQAFCDLTGYSMDEIIGRNCRFLQGPDTDPVTVQALHEVMTNPRYIYVEILNYRKDGTPFWNGLLINPVHGPDGKLKYFVGSQSDVTLKKETERQLSESNARLKQDRDELEQRVAERTQALTEALERQTSLVHELDHRVKNNVQMMIALVSLESRGPIDDETKTVLKRLRDRLQALGAVHRNRYHTAEVQSFNGSDFLRTLLDEFTANPRFQGRTIEAKMTPMTVPASKAAPFALLMNEHLEHEIQQALDLDNGLIEVGLEHDDTNLKLNILRPIAVKSPALTAKHANTTLCDMLHRQIGSYCKVIDTPGHAGVTIFLPLEWSEAS